MILPKEMAGIRPSLLNRFITCFAVCKTCKQGHLDIG